jgi:hypothetical protein
MGNAVSLVYKSRYYNVHGPAESDVERQHGFANYAMVL